MTTVLFVSYRRTDSRSATGRLCDHLRTLGWGDASAGKRMFVDIDDIPPGKDFREVIRETLHGCDVVHVVIGPGWLGGGGEEASRRLDDPSDTHRLEVAAALASDALVIPVLVEGASHPSAAELPPDLEALSYRNAWELTERRFADDVAELARRLDEAVAESAASETGSVSDDLSSAGVGDTSDPPVRSPCPRGPRWWWQIERPKQLLVIVGLAVGVAAFAVAATILISLDNSGGLDQPTPEERQLAINQLMESNDATEAQAECLLGSVIDEHGWSIASYYVFEEEEGTLDPLEVDPIIARWGVCRMSDE